MKKTILKLKKSIKHEDVVCFGFTVLVVSLYCLGYIKTNGVIPVV